MISSRLGRFENRKAQKRLWIAIGGSIGLLVFIAIFGLKLLVGFSLLVDKIRGNSPVTTQAQNSELTPPILDPQPEATYSATLSISGKGLAKTQAIIYINDIQMKKVPVEDDNTFLLPNFPVDEGDLTISTKLLDAKGNVSELSNLIKITIDRKPPVLEITKPSDGTKIQDGTKKVIIEGKTDEDAKLTINDRIAIVRMGGGFSYSMPLSDGDNTLNVVAIDPAGNRTTVQLKISYQN